MIVAGAMFVGHKRLRAFEALMRDEPLDVIEVEGTLRQQ